MKIHIPKIVEAVDFGEYAEILRGQYLRVWVNPPMEVLHEHTRALSNAKSEKLDALFDWYAKIWSQGAADTHWTVEEITQLEQDDPAMLGWMISQTWEQRREHTDRRKKA